MKKVNPLKYNKILSRVFDQIPRRDFSIDCILENTICDLYIDKVSNPTTFLIKNGNFYTLAGDCNISSSEILKIILDNSTILFSTNQWIKKIKINECITISKYKRYSFSHESISINGIKKIIFDKSNCSTLNYRIIGIDLFLGRSIMDNEFFSYQLDKFNSVESFLNEGIGFVALNNNNEILGVASTSTICKKGMDINIIVLPNLRRKGVGKSLSAFLINAILDKEIIPNWDAANKNSYYLALSLGYTPIGSYDAYHISKK